MSFPYLFPPLEIFQSNLYTNKEENHLINKFNFDELQKEEMTILNKELLIDNLQVDKETILRFFFQNNFNSSSTIKSLKKASEFLDVFQRFKLSEISQKIIKTGGIYIFGRDSNFVPNLYILTDVLIQYQETMSSINNSMIYLIIILIENMLVQNIVEKFNIIIQGFNSENKVFFFHTLLSKIEELVNELFPLRINKIIIQDKDNEELYPLVENLQYIRQYISFVNHFGEDKYLKEIDSQQTEIKFGGSIDNLTSFWPPKSPFTSKKLLITQKTLQKKQVNMFQVIQSHKNIGMIIPTMEQSFFNNSIIDTKASCIEEDFKPCLTNKNKLEQIDEDYKERLSFQDQESQIQQNEFKILKQCCQKSLSQQYLFQNDEIFENKKQFMELSKTKSYQNFPSQIEKINEFQNSGGYWPKVYTKDYQQNTFKFQKSQNTSNLVVGFQQVQRESEMKFLELFCCGSRQLNFQLNYNQ